MLFVQSPSEAVASQLPIFLTQGAALCPGLWRNTLSSRSSQHKKAMFSSCAKCHTCMLCHLPVSRFCICPVTFQAHTLQWPLYPSPCYSVASMKAWAVPPNAIIPNKHRETIFYMYECFVCLCVCSTCTTSAHGNQNKAPDSLELESQRAVSHHVGARDQIFVLCKNSQCS